jgi:opacity protein-like surface antigen
MRFLLCVVLATLVADVAEAQDRPAPPRPSPDFLFQRPEGSVTVRGSWVFARGGSDWYDFVTDQLTLEPNDFNSPAIGLDLGFAVARRAEVVVGLEFNQSTTASEYRDFVDNNRLPITQQTRLREFNVSGNLKFALTERGREVGRFAWVPRPVVPYAGAGGGMLWFQMLQTGDFVDFVDFSVFPDVFRSDGWTPSAQVFGGVDIKVFRRLFLTLDGRYLWAAGDLGSDWIDFDPIDLTGARISAGLNVVF